MIAVVITSGTDGGSQLWSSLELLAVVLMDNTALSSPWSLGVVGIAGSGLWTTW